MWPSKTFSEVKFKNGDFFERASMAVDLISSRKYLGYDCKGITEVLGEETGDYYRSDSNSTYRLTNNQSTDWILTFQCGDEGVVKRVFIRKSCCSASQKILATILGIR
jgi:hypothetical protein